MTAASHSFRGKLNKDHVSTKHLLSFKAKKLLLSCHIAAYVSVKRNRRAVSSFCQPEGSFPHIPAYRCSITTGVRCSGNCSCGIMLNYNSQVQLPVLSTEHAGLGCWEVWFSNIQGGRSYPVSAFLCHITLVCFSGTVTLANFIVVLRVYAIKSVLPPSNDHTDLLQDDLVPSWSFRSSNCIPIASEIKCIPLAAGFPLLLFPSTFLSSKDFPRELGLCIMCIN